MSRTSRAILGAVIAVAMAAPIAFSPAGAAVEPAPRVKPVRFAGIAWGSTAAQVGKRFDREGWRLRVPREDGGTIIVGRVWGRSADIRPEYGEGGGLAAVTLKFHPESESDALALYRELVERLRGLHGAPAAEVAPARPLATEWVGRDRRLLTRQELTAATLWVSAAEDAAAVQLDADRYVWVRYESRAWAVAHAGAAELP